MTRYTNTYAQQYRSLMMRSVNCIFFRGIAIRHLQRVQPPRCGALVRLFRDVTCTPLVLVRAHAATQLLLMAQTQAKP